MITKKCKNCGKLFSFKKSHKHKYKKKFCSRKCHYIYKTRNSNKNYKTKAYKIFLPICAICSKINDLCVHHIDLNHENNPNDGSNWIILCKSHHAKIHFLIKKYDYIRCLKIMIKEEKLALKVSTAKNIFSKKD